MKTEVAQVHDNSEPGFSPSAPASVGGGGRNSISLACLFQIVTACGVFFACLQVSAVLAIVGTVVIAPAVIRTGLLCELQRRNQDPLDMMIRINFFVSSLWTVIVTAVFSFSVFVLVSLLFGVAAALVSIMAGASNMSLDAAIVATAGGMVWGIAGGILATVIFVMRTWIPKHMIRFPNPEYSLHIR